MTKKMTLRHNLDDVELEEYLEKALKGVKKYEEPNRRYPDAVANHIKDDADLAAQKVINNMLSEIQAVLTQK